MTSIDWRTDTGPIDFFNPDDPVVAEIISEPVGVVVDAKGNHHGKGTGRFVAKELAYGNLVTDEPEPQEVIYVVKAYEQVPLETLSIAYPQNSVQGQHRLTETVTVTGGWRRRTYSNGRIVFLRNPVRSEDDVVEEGDPGYSELIKLRPEAAPEAAQTVKKITPAMIRKWGQANGFLIGDRGKLPQTLIDAYHDAHK